MALQRKLARLLGVEKTAARLLGKMHPHDGSRIDGVEYADGVELERIVFICGLHRSGTTLLERMLATEYEVSYLRANVPESEGQHMQGVYSPASTYGGPGRFAFSREFHQATEALTDYPRHRRAILADWRRFLVGTSPVLLEKSPPNLTKISWLRKVFPGSRFVIVSRDPRAVAGATKKWSQTSLQELVAHWNAAYSRALDDYEESDCIILRYEDFVDDPDGQLTRIAEAIDLKRRAGTEALEKRHQQLVNSNAKYIDQQDPMYFGRGAWSEFGYEF